MPININVDDPWGGESVDLKGIKLSAHQKHWIGYQIVHLGKMARDLSERFNLQKHLIRKYARKIKNGKYLHSSCGRPRILDPEGFSNVWANLCSNSSRNNADLKKYLLEEYRRTTKQRNPTIEERNLPKRLKNHTREVYVSLFDFNRRSEVVHDQLVELRSMKCFGAGATIECV
jgi:hypothetical protein